MSESSSWSRGRAALRAGAVVALLILAAITTRRNLEGLAQHEPHESCPERLVRRYAPLRDHIPARGVVGYIGPELANDGCNAKFMAQYVLAPVLVTHVWDKDNRVAARRTDFVVPMKPPLVIVDRHEPQAAGWLADNPDYSVVMDLGDGLLITGRMR